jgi:hypothetical protein
MLRKYVIIIGKRREGNKTLKDTTETNKRR